jgi:hypothetical protein
MFQDLSSMYHAAQAEQRLTALRAERAWIKAEAERQGRFSPRPSAIARLKALTAKVIQLIARRSVERAGAPPASRRRTASAS